MGARRRSREIALQALYALDVSPEREVEAALADCVERFGPGERGEDGAPARPADDRAFTRDLVSGVVARRREIDGDLAALSRSWRLERMALVDRNVMRIALYELKHRPDVPARVTLNEAVELAKRFGTAEAGAFVNGLLDRAASELGIRK